LSKLYETVSSDLRPWLERQKVFFVASAPLSPDGHVNCSPKGGDTFRVLGESQVAYLDLTGSGIETIAHIQENGRIAVMFCAFEGSPRIVRLHGKARVVYPDHSDYVALFQKFPSNPGARAIILVDLTRVSDSCGYSVPLMEFAGLRNTLDQWATKKGSEELVAYRQKKNQYSIDGIKGYEKA
jgi:hypothetical protein